MLLTWYAASWGTLQAFLLVIIISLVRGKGRNGSGIWDVLATKPILENVQKMCMVTLPVDHGVQQHYANYHIKQVTYLLFGHTLVLIHFHKMTSSRSNSNFHWDKRIPIMYPALLFSWLNWGKGIQKHAKHVERKKKNNTKQSKTKNPIQKHGDVVSCTQFLVFSFLDFPSIRPTIMRLVQSYITYMLFHLRKKKHIRLNIVGISRLFYLCKLILLSKAASHSLFQWVH